MRRPVAAASRRRRQRRRPHGAAEVPRRRADTLTVRHGKGCGSSAGAEARPTAMFAEESGRRQEEPGSSEAGDEQLTYSHCRYECCPPPQALTWQGSSDHKRGCQGLGGNGGPRGKPVLLWFRRLRPTPPARKSTSGQVETWRCQEMLQIETWRCQEMSHS